MRQIDNMTPQELNELDVKGMTAPRTASERPAPNKAQQIIREATGQSPDFVEQEPEETNDSPETGTPNKAKHHALYPTNLHGDKWTGEMQDGIYVYLDQQGNLYESKERPVYRLPITINRYSGQPTPNT